MIAVVADDFTGAAEIGGIGLKYGFKVIIETEVKDAGDAGLLIIDADTRSLPASEVAAKTKEIIQKLLKLQPEYIFKKLDSVLRGNIAAELVAHMEISNKNRSIIIAANPKMGRLICDGRYTIKSVPLAETFFANDPEYPISSSLVLDLIQSTACKVVSKNVDEELPDSGIVIGNVTNQLDLKKWARVVDPASVIAGGSGFFDVLLGTKFSKVKPQNNQISLSDRTLFVFGSAFPKSMEIVERFNGNGIVKSNMPEEIYNQKVYRPEIMESWENEIVENLNRKQKVIISVEYNHSREEGLSMRIKQTIAQLVENVNRKIELTDLVIEGGATTAEILKSLNISKLYPFKELEFGIIQMNVEAYPNLTVTTKPGSYIWPESLVFENLEIEKKH